MYITLVDDWDTPIQSPNGKELGHFVGRFKEISTLTNEIMRKNQGTILVTGHRGVGKTSFVYKALQQVKKNLKESVVVLINAPQLENYLQEGNELKENKDYSRTILVNLIRRLYATTRDDDDETNKEVRRNIEQLYKKAISTYQFTEEHNLNLEMELEKTTKFDLSFFSEKTNLITFGAFWSLSVSISLIPIPETFLWLKTLAVALLSFPVPIFVSWNITRTKISTNKRSEKSNAQELYSHDNNTNNLEFDLEQIHRDFSDKNTKVIYLIDELDKLERSNKPCESVLKMFKYFKNFFSLSSAIFIFVGGEEIHKYFDTNGDENAGTYRSQEYTFFTSKYFLSRPSEDDLNRFIDEIVENKEEVFKSNTDDYEWFKRFLIFKARGDYFDLLKEIKDQVTNFDGVKSKILLGKLDEKGLLKAKIQKALSVVYNEKHIAFTPSKWNENEKILRRLYSKANEYINLPLGEQFIENAENNFEAAAERDFNSFLYRLEVLNLINEQKTVTNISTTFKREYKYMGHASTKVPDKLDFRSEIEEKFIDKFDNLLFLVENAHKSILALQEIEPGERDSKAEELDRSINYINQWVPNLGNNYASTAPMYRTLTKKNPPYDYHREEIEENTNIITSISSFLLKNEENFLPKILMNTFSDLRLQIKPLNLDNNLFIGPFVDFRKKITPTNFVIFTSDYSKQILIMQSDPNNLIEKYKDLINKNIDAYHIVIIDSSLNYPNIKGVMSFSIFKKVSNKQLQKLSQLKKWMLETSIQAPAIETIR